MCDFAILPQLRSGTISAATSLLQSRELARLTDSLATPADRRHARRYCPIARQTQSLAARVLLRALLEAATGVPGRIWRIQKCADGRTAGWANGMVQGLPVSVSHSQNRVACAVSTNRAIGVDLEYCRPDRDVLAIAGYAFADDEIAAVREGGASVFYRIWTMREAIAKASGAGMAAMLGRRIFGSKADAEKLEAKVDGQRYLLEHRNLSDGYSLSLAVGVDGEAGLATATV